MPKVRVLKAILGTTLFVFIFSFILGINSEIAHSPAGFSGGLLIASFAGFIALISLLFLALPLHLYLVHKKMNLIRWYALAGLLPGIIMIFGFNFYGNDPLYTKLLQSIAMSIIGAISATVFGYLANEKNT